MLTQSQLKELLHYDPLTGDFTWLKVLHPKVKVGNVAGHTAKNGYHYIGVYGRAYPAGRLAWLYMTGEHPEHDIDHIDRIRKNNVFSNLRQLTRTENNHNTGLSKNNTSGFKGVTKGRKGRWRASARTDGKLTHLGEYATPELASKAYQDYINVFRECNPTDLSTRGFEQETLYASKLTASG